MSLIYRVVAKVEHFLITSDRKYNYNRHVLVAMESTIVISNYNNPFDISETRGN